MTTTRAHRQICITGSRASTLYGQQIAAQIAADLSGYGYEIITTLGYGIDEAVVRGVLAANQYARVPLTLVTANGPDAAEAFPVAHTALLATARDRGATVISPVANGTTPTGSVFEKVRRMCVQRADAVLIIEAAIRSGAQHAADQATQHDRPLYVTPGPVTNAQSDGTLQLLQRGAYPIGRARDLHEHLTRA